MKRGQIDKIQTMTTFFQSERIVISRFHIRNSNAHTFVGVQRHIHHSDTTPPHAKKIKELTEKSKIKNKNEKYINVCKYINRRSSLNNSKYVVI